jgi:hypothetical protein
MKDFQVPSTKIIAYRKEFGDLRKCYKKRILALIENMEIKTGNGEMSHFGKLRTFVKIKQISQKFEIEKALLRARFEMFQNKESEKTEATVGHHTPEDELSPPSPVLIPFSQSVARA